MNKLSQHIIPTLMAFALVCLWIPMLQQITGVVEEKPLAGAVTKESAPVWSMDAWFDESFQEQTETYLNQTFGFRNWLLRFHNQFDYSLFKKAHARGVVVGNDDYLYEVNYIRAYLGEDYVGFDKIVEESRRFARVRDTLERLNKQIIFVFAPGKAAYLPEYLPKPYDKTPRAYTNYRAYRDALRKVAVPVLDLKAWFTQMKPNTPYPLYPKCGIHWSKYGEVLAMDTLMRFLERETGKRFVEVVIDRVNWSNHNGWRDYDLGEGLNLLRRLPAFPMGYPEFRFDTQGMDSQRVMVVADSYYMGIFDDHVSSRYLGNGQFWYYNTEIYTGDYNNRKAVVDAEILTEVLRHDVVVILQTDAGLNRFAYGFIDNLYDAFYQPDPAKSSVKKLRRAHLLCRLQESDYWQRDLEKKARQNHKPFQEEALNMANYLLWLENNGDVLPVNYIDSLLNLK